MATSRSTSTRGACRRIVAAAILATGLLAECAGALPCAPVSAYVGRWAHSKEMRASALLPIALSRFGLLPAKVKALPRGVRHSPEPTCS